MKKQPRQTTLGEGLEAAPTQDDQSRIKAEIRELVARNHSAAAVLRLLNEHNDNEAFAYTRSHLMQSSIENRKTYLQARAELAGLYKSLMNPKGRNNAGK